MRAAGRAPEGTGHSEPAASPGRADLWVTALPLASRRATATVRAGYATRRSRNRSASAGQREWHVVRTLARDGTVVPATPTRRERAGKAQRGRHWIARRDRRPPERHNIAGPSSVSGPRPCSATPRWQHGPAHCPDDRLAMCALVPSHERLGGSRRVGASARNLATERHPWTPAGPPVRWPPVVQGAPPVMLLFEEAGPVLRYAPFAQGRRG